jgi:hypothetical protein
MADIIEKIKTNTNIIKKLVNENETLLEQLNVNRKITENGKYTFKIANLQEFIDKFKLVIEDIGCQNSFLMEYSSNGDYAIYLSDKHGIMMPDAGYLAIREIGRYNKESGYSNVDEIDLYVKIDDEKIILYDENTFLKTESGFKSNDYDYWFNTLNKTEHSDIYSYETICKCSRLRVCTHHSRAENEKCNCFAESIKQCEEAKTKIGIFNTLELGQEIVNNTIKCTHKCNCNVCEHPYQCWRPRFKYTVNITTREIHLYIDYE